MQAAASEMGGDEEDPIDAMRLAAFGLLDRAGSGKSGGSSRPTEAEHVARAESPSEAGLHTGASACVHTKGSTLLSRAPRAGHPAGATPTLPRAGSHPPGAEVAGQAAVTEQGRLHVLVPPSAGGANPSPPPSPAATSPSARQVNSRAWSGGEGASEATLLGEQRKRKVNSTYCSQCYTRCVHPCYPRSLHVSVSNEVGGEGGGGGWISGFQVSFDTPVVPFMCFLLSCPAYLCSALCAARERPSRCAAAKCAPP